MEVVPDEPPAKIPPPDQQQAKASIIHNLFSPETQPCTTAICCSLIVACLCSGHSETRNNLVNLDHVRLDNAQRLFQLPTELRVSLALQSHIFVFQGIQVGLDDGKVCGYSFLDLVSQVVSEVGEFF
jgi:hypothetical protein